MKINNRINRSARGIKQEKKMKMVGFKKNVIVMTICLVIVSCGSGNRNRNETQDENSSKIVIDEPVKTFLKNTLPANYSFYTLNDYLPLTMDDLKTNGIFFASRVPNGFLPSDFINVSIWGKIPRLQAKTLV